MLKLLFLLVLMFFVATFALGCFAGIKATIYQIYWWMLP